MKTDVIIVGNGIAGLSLSYLLTERKIDHLVLKRLAKPKTVELAETMPPSALVLLESLNLLELFKKSSNKTFGYHSLWHSERLSSDHFMSHNPYKYGLKLNKKKLLNDLEELLCDQLFSFDNILKVDTSNDWITVKLESKDAKRSIKGRLIVDATGRSRNILKHFANSSDTYDDQLAFSCHLPFFKHPKLIHSVFVESFENGWGIVSALNDRTNVMTLYTQKDSPLLPKLKDYQNWKSILGGSRFLKDFLFDSIQPKVVGGIANSSKATQISGPNWLAIGDAAIAFDPLSSHGVSNAIYCAKAAADSIENFLKKGETDSFQTYEHTLCAVFDLYMNHRSMLYGLEKQIPV